MGKMKEQQELPDWLPIGWSVEVRRRRNGKTYKCFTDPTTEFKFYSKPEVLRHLQSARKRRSESNKKTTKRNTKKSTSKPAKINYVCKKTVAEGLPPGWVKEMRIRKKGRERKADKYYIDPATSHVFRSLKEVSRYLQTGEIVKRSWKLKEPARADVESSNNLSLPAKDDTKRLPKIRARKEALKDKVLKPVATRKGVKVAESKADEEHDKHHRLKLGTKGKGTKSPVSEAKIKDVNNEDLTSGAGDGVATGDMNKEAVKSCKGSKRTAKRKTSPADKRLHKRRKESDFSRSTEIVASVMSEVPDTLPLVNDTEKHGDGREKCTINEVIDERETAMSKQLAAAEDDQLPEQKDNSQTVSVLQLSIGKSDESKNLKDINSSEENVRRVHIGHALDEKQIKGPVLLPAGYIPLKRDYVGAFGFSSKNDKSEAEPWDSTLNNFLTDPCIEFAIQTLTGAIQTGGDDAQTQGCSLYKQNSPPTSAVTCGNSWTDPCFDFAVKTLTGEIPLEDDPRMQTSFQQPLNSSKAQRCNGLTLATSKSENVEINHPFTHSDAAKKPSS